MPNYSIPYVPVPYAQPAYDNSSATLKLVDLLRQRGIDTANAQLQQGNLSALAWGNVGNTINNTLGQVLQARRDAPINDINRVRAQEATATQAGTVAATQLMAPPAQVRPGESGPEQPSNPYLTQDGLWDISGMQKALASQGKQLPTQLADSLDRQNKLHQEDQAASEARDTRQAALLSNGAAAALHAIDQLKMDPAEAVKWIGQQLSANSTFPAGQLAQVTGQLLSDPSQIVSRLTLLRDAQKGPPPPVVGKPGDVFLNPNNLGGTPLAVVPEKPPTPTRASLAATAADPSKSPEERAKAQAALTSLEPQAKATPATLGSLPDVIQRWATEHGRDPLTLSVKEVEDIAKTHTEATQKAPILGGMNSLYAETDPKVIAAQIRAGAQAPDLSQYGRIVQGAVATELGKPGPNGELPYNLAQALTDWKATQKHIATLNGSQQLRLNQSINALPDILDTVDELASKWKGGTFPVLNKVNLSLAKNGAYGKDVASVANQLDAQIADATADLSNIYMGGNSPTDQALNLAAKNLKGEWSEQVLKDMVTLARKNVGIRRNSINNTGVAGASPGNPYAPALPTQEAPQTPKPTGRYNPATGRVEAVQ